MESLKELDGIRTDIGVTLIYSLAQLEAQQLKIEKLIKQQRSLLKQREAAELRAAELARVIQQLRKKARILKEMIGDSWKIHEPL